MKSFPWGYVMHFAIGLALGVLMDSPNTGTTYMALAALWRTYKP